MPSWLTNLLPLEGVKILLVFFLSFLVGLQREEHRGDKTVAGYSFGGVRTFPLVGLIGYAIAFLSGGQWPAIMVGFAAVSAFLWLSYKHKLEKYEQAGATTEVSALAIYLVGALVSRGEFWIGTAIAIIGVLLLELKTMLEGLSQRLPPGEVLSFSKFLLLGAVILPIVPNRTYGPIAFNPFKTWLIVVAASGVSYGSYLLEKSARGAGGVYLSAVLGGAYSSTMTTVVLAKRAREVHGSSVYAGSILMASGVMYFRLLVLVALFNRMLAARLLVPFVLLGGAGLLGGWLWPRLRGAGAQQGTPGLEAQNPLELSAAFLFAVMFVAMLAVTHYAVQYLGRGGMYGLAALTGLGDPAPFILGLTQAPAASAPLALAAGAIVIAAASNNVVKGFYAFGFADRETGAQALELLVGFAALGVLPVFLT